MSRATMKDVAERSGVSITTVSHVLERGSRQAGEPADPGARAQVAEELLYRPNQLARGLRTQRSGMIGFLSDRVSTTPYAGRMIIGAQDAAAEAGCLLVLLNSGGDPGLEEREVEAMLSARWTASSTRSVLPPGGHPAAEPFAGPGGAAGRSQRRRRPSARWCRTRSGARGPRSRRLLAAGHRRIGYVATDEDIPARRAAAGGVPTGSGGVRAAVRSGAGGRGEAGCPRRATPGRAGATDPARSTDRPSSVSRTGGHGGLSGGGRARACPSRPTCLWSVSTTRS